MKGFTLIETIIYLALFFILLMGVFTSAYSIMGSGAQEAGLMEQDAEILNQVLIQI